MRKLMILLTLAIAAPSWGQTVSPAPRSATTATQPTISASFNQRINGARVWVDGNDLTNRARVRGNTVAVVPPYNLGYGLHQVKVVTNNGQRANWNFAIQNPNAVGWNNKGNRVYNNNKNVRFNIRDRQYNNGGYYDKRGHWHNY